MRYLKKFNESKLEDVEELKDFCETQLAYLLDKDFMVSVNHITAGDILFINIRRDKFDNTIPFTWNEIKDYFLPFLYNLNNNYKITHNYVLRVAKFMGDIYAPSIFLFNDNYTAIPVKELLSDNTYGYGDKPLLQISIHIE